MNNQKATVSDSIKSLSPWFARTAMAILFITGGVKIWSSFGNAKLLAHVDPIIGVKFGHLMLLAGLMEIGVALVCLMVRQSGLANALVAWLATSFLAYRFGLWWVHWDRPCGCLGNLTDAIHLSPQVADNIMKAVLGYLLVGSYGLLIWEWKRNKQSRIEPLPAGAAENS
jgi:hypothetical protein